MSEFNFRNGASGPAAEGWERLSALFDSAMSLSPESRAAFLETACVTDAPLRAELLTLISGADDAPSFLGALASDVLSPAFDRATAADGIPVDELEGIAAELADGRDSSNAAGPREISESAAAETSRDSFTGRRIRHFEIRTSLGSGGMGVVYLGRDTILGRDVALKFLPPEQFTDSTARRRLVREAQAASALDDPNVCAIYAIEETDDGGLCLVMNYCAGGTLRDRIRAGLLSVSDAITIVTQLASGLASAHRSNIVHRDLKPANIGFGDNAVAKILDFGVAVRSGGDDAARSMGSAAVAGTLPYMAPEVLRGKQADARADVWALGVIFHEMLTGRRPYVGPTEAALLYAILEESPAPLVRDDGVTIPPSIGQLVSIMLAKRADDRPADGDAVLVRLRAIAESSERIASAPDMVTLAKPGGKRRWHPLRTPVVAGIGIALLFALGRTLTRRNRVASVATVPIEVVRSANPLPSIAVLPFAVRGGPELEYLREGMVDLLTPAFEATGLMRGVDPNSSIGAARALNATTIDSATARTLAERLGVRRYVVGSVVRAGKGFTLLATLYYADGKDVARAHINVANAEHLSAGVESLVRQLVAAELQAPGDTVAGLAATMTTSNRALRAYLDGERELRDARPAAAVIYFTRAVQEDSLFALAWYRLARAARWSEVDSLNTRAVQRAFDLSAALPLRLQQLVRGYHALRVGSPVDAERQFRQIVSDYPTDVDAWMLLGETLFDNNQFQGRPTNDAVAAFRRVMALDMRNREVTVYLMELAARANRRGELDTLFQMYFSPNSAGEQPGIRQTYLALHARRAQLPERVIDDPVSAQIALRRVGSDTSDLRAARKFASVLALSSNGPAMRLEGLLALATLDWSAGQLEAAGRHWRDAAVLDSSATLLHRALMFVAPTDAVNSDTLLAVRRALETEPIPAIARGGLSRDEQRSLRVYLGGLLSKQLRDTVALGRAVEQLASARASDRLATPLRAALRGHLAIARNRNAEAVVAFESSVVSIPFELRSHVPALGQQVDRFARAEALRALGRVAEAKQWYASILDGPALWSVPYRSLVAERLRTFP